MPVMSSQDPIHRQHQVAGKPARALRPSAPGVRWIVAPGKAVRFSKSADRVHWDGGTRRNVITFLPIAEAPARPSDRALLELLTLCALPPACENAAHREWTFRQADTGQWHLTLNLRGGGTGRMSLPAPDSRERLSGCAVALQDDRSILAAAHTLWSEANKIECGAPSMNAHAQTLKEVFS